MRDDPERASQLANAVHQVASEAFRPALTTLVSGECRTAVGERRLLLSFTSWQLPSAVAGMAAHGRGPAAGAALSRGCRGWHARGRRLAAHAALEELPLIGRRLGCLPPKNLSVRFVSTRDALMPVYDQRIVVVTARNVAQQEPVSIMAWQALGHHKGYAVLCDAIPEMLWTSESGGQILYEARALLRHESQRSTLLLLPGTQRFGTAEKAESAAVRYAMGWIDERTSSGRRPDGRREDTRAVAKPVPRKTGGDARHGPSDRRGAVVGP
jgi:hypothetical protein